MPQLAKSESQGSQLADLEVLDFTDELAADFYRLNAEWIEALFRLEQIDRQVLSRPRETIIERGGIILFLKAGDLGIIGTCALMPSDEGGFELTKMAIASAAQGRKAGEFLLRAVLDRARSEGIGELFLLTNSKLAPAIHLYEKLGFRHDPEIMRRYGGHYSRCDVAMRYSPGGSSKP